jgi:hypothetical protein
MAKNASCSSNAWINRWAALRAIRACRKNL